MRAIMRLKNYWTNISWRAETQVGEAGVRSPGVFADTHRRAGRRLSLFLKLHRLLGRHT